MNMNKQSPQKGRTVPSNLTGIGILAALFAVVFLFTSCEMIGDLFGNENPSTEPDGGGNPGTEQPGGGTGGGSGGSGGNSGRFRVSLSTVDATGSTDGVAAQACQSDFGSGYDVAAWEDIKRMYAATPSSDRPNFITNSLGLSIGSEGDSLLVKRSNSEIYSGRRHYYITYHDGSVPGHYLQHDNIDNSTISLGSWWVSLKALCFEKSGTEQTGGGTGGGNSTQTVTDGSSVAARLSSSGERDRYAVALSAGQSLTVYTTGSTDTFGRLQDSGGTSLATNDDGGSGSNFRISHTVSEAGTYYIIVSGYNNATGSYRLHVAISAAQTGGGAGGGNSTQTVTDGSSVAASLSSSGERDRYSVALSAGQTLTVYTTGGTDTFGRLQDSGGTSLATNDDGGSGRNFRISHTVSAAGTYYIIVSGYGNATGSYRLHVAISAASAAGGFRVSLSTVDATGNTDGVAAQACQSDFGSGYDVAAWEDIKRVYAATPTGDRPNFITNSLGLSIGGNGFLVKRSNSEIYSGRRHYFIDYHNGSVPGHYLQHDNIDNSTISLGSWWVSLKALCYGS